MLRSFRVARTETHAHPAHQVTVPVLAVALGIGSQAAITTIDPDPLHLTQKVPRTHQGGRIGGPDFGLAPLLAA